MSERLFSESEAISSLTPNDAVSYLRTTGWREQEVLKGRASIWTTTTADGETVEALVPLAAGVLDFRSRVRQLLGAIEVAERRPRLEILADLSETSADTVRVATGISDSIRLSEGAHLASSVYDLLLASACAAVRPRPVYHTRKPDVAVSFASSLELGQTERGSFVLRILSRVPPSLASQQVSMPWGTGEQPRGEEPFERQALVVFAGALQAAQWAGQRALATGALDEFQNAVAQGVSANFCTALAGLGGYENRDVRIGVSWARTRRPVEGGNTSTVFDRNILSVIGEAGRLLRETLPEPDFEVVGPVVQLARDTGSPMGKVTVSALIDGQLKRVLMELPEEAYNGAIFAHKLGNNVSCYGELRKGGRTYSLLEPKGFRVLPVDNENG